MVLVCYFKIFFNILKFDIHINCYNKDTCCPSLQLSWLSTSQVGARLWPAPTPSAEKTAAGKPGLVRLPLPWTHFCSFEFTLLPWKGFWFSIFLLVLLITWPWARRHLIWPAQHSPNCHFVDGVQREREISLLLAMGPEITIPQLLLCVKAQQDR